MPTTLDVDLLPILDRVTAVLSDHDPVTQQKVLELAAARHAMRMGEVAKAHAVAAGMHEHIVQIIRQFSG